MEWLNQFLLFGIYGSLAKYTLKLLINKQYFTKHLTCIHGKCNISSYNSNTYLFFPFQIRSFNLRPMKTRIGYMAEEHRKKRTSKKPKPVNQFQKHLDRVNEIAENFQQLVKPKPKPKKLVGSNRRGPIYD